MLFQLVQSQRKYQIHYLRLSLKRLRKLSQFSRLPLRLSEEPNVQLRLALTNKRKMAVNLKNAYQKFPRLQRESSQFASRKEKQKSTPRKTKPQNKQPSFRVTDNALIDSFALPYHLNSSPCYHYRCQRQRLPNLPTPVPSTPLRNRQQIQKQNLGRFDGVAAWAGAGLLGSFFAYEPGQLELHKEGVEVEEKSIGAR